VTLYLFGFDYWLWSAFSSGTPFFVSEFCQVYVLCIDRCVSHTSCFCQFFSVPPSFQPIFSDRSLAYENPWATVYPSPFATLLFLRLSPFFLGALFGRLTAGPLPRFLSPHLPRFHLLIQLPLCWWNVLNCGPRHSLFSYLVFLPASD